MKIELWMVFEAVAQNKEDVEESLNDHIEKLGSDNKIEIVESEIEEAESVKDPHPGLDEGFSQVAEVVAKVDDFTKAVTTVINYGPTYVQIEGPEDYQMELPEMQDSLQEMANTVHQYAQMGLGGVLVSRPNEEN